jgi:outer membrane murein-binding lipoprotein Lpp
MSQTSKIVLGVAIVAVALLAGFYYWQSGNASRMNAEGSETTTLPTGSKTDDASLEQDFSAIDAQLTDVSTDNANADASVNAAVTQ